eukprot:GHVT01009692.1.p3 GENE.GHVT01009692.1~~GHVT01009692.1.p3  ORF type:complete len:111 (+),score=15.16 GHVT01009692.1:1273-1605(+)
MQEGRKLEWWVVLDGQTVSVSRKLPSSPATSTGDKVTSCVIVPCTILSEHKKKENPPLVFSSSRVAEIAVSKTLPKEMPHLISEQVEAIFDAETSKPLRSSFFDPHLILL